MKPHKLRARVLAEWRGLPGEAPERPPAKDVADVVKKLMADLGLQDRLREEEVRGAWAGLVGPFIAQNSHPQRLRDGVLIVSVLQPTLRYDLDRTWKRELLCKLQTRFGTRTVRDLRFQIG